MDFGKTFIVLLLPAGANLGLAVASFFFNAKDFTNPLVAVATIAIALSCAFFVPLIAYKIRHLGPRQLLLHFTAQGLALILIFGAIYRGNSLMHDGKEVPMLEEGQTAFYFSVVTWTTLGYGDYSPTPAMQLFAALEALLGYVVFGIAVGLSTAILCTKSEDADL